MGAPPFIGLTGGVASGKSSALEAFERAGAATLSTDAVVHELMGDDGVADELVSRWGVEIAQDGIVDRAAVAERVFGRPEELAWLEGLLHPRVAQRVVEWREQVPDSAPAAVVEVPLLFESGMDEVFDATVCVVAGDTLRRERASERGTGQVEGRDARQLSEQEKARRATHVVRNDGTLDDLEEAVREVLDRIAGATA